MVINSAIINKTNNHLSS